MILDVGGTRSTLMHMFQKAVFLGLLSVFVGFGVACGSSRTAETERSEGEITIGQEREESRPSESSNTENTDIVIGEDPCSSDADCVPAQCCHASACVLATNAPSCGDALCTMDCQMGTIDCGGGCLCHNGRCAARLMPAPAGLDRPQ
jgi:hypothetical protein